MSAAPSDRLFNDEAANSLTQQGIAVMRGALRDDPHLIELVRELEAFGRTFAPDFSLGDSQGLLARGTKVCGDFYRALRYLPSLAALGASPRMLALCRDFGLKFPALMKSCNIRMDKPGDDGNLFQWHQDVTYLLGSMNSLTLWIPLGPVDATHGSVAYIPASHGTLHPFRFTSEQARGKTAQLAPRDVRLEREPAGSGELLEAQFGDLIVFSQFLLHRSTPNRSARCRWTVQLRFSDLSEPAFREAGFPFGDITTITAAGYLDHLLPISSDASQGGAMKHAGVRS